VADSAQERRRKDRDGPARSLYERVILLVLGITALAGAILAVGWLWAHSGVGSTIRDSGPNWAPDGRLIFASDQDGQADLCVRSWVPAHDCGRPGSGRAE